jgi:hypothetical protein
VLRWGDGFRCEEERLKPGCVRRIMGCSHQAFYRAIGWWKAGIQGEGGSGGGTSMVSVTGDGNGEGEVMGCNYFWRGGGEAAPQCRRRM